jgi:hypothetical protein
MVAFPAPFPLGYLRRLIHFNDPQSVRKPRSIPGSQKLVVIACRSSFPA